MSTREHASVRREAESAAGEALIARTGRAAVDLLEGLICGDAAVPSASVAEGLALAGTRAASRLGRGLGSSPSPGRPDAPAAWVHHRVRCEGPDAGLPFLVCLDARTAQQALDHCLVAHLIADRLRRPVSCSIDRDAADGVHLLRLPRPEWVHEIAADAPHETREDGSLDAPRLRRVVDWALAAVAERTGRTLPPDGIVATESPPTVRVIGHSPRAARSRATAEEVVGMAAAPACEWSERLLLSTAANLGRTVELSLRRPRRAPEGCSALSVHAGDRAEREEWATRTLFVAHPTLLAREGLVSQLPAGASVLVCGRGEPARLAARLPPALRQRARAGEITVHGVDPWSALGAERPSPHALRRVLEGALLAVTAWPAALRGESPDPLADVQEAAPDDVGALLGAGAAAVAPLNLTATAPAPAAPRAPCMPRDTGTRAEAWRADLWHFHLTGEGAWSEADGLPSLPLWPAGLDALVARHCQTDSHPLCLDHQDGSGEAPLARVLAASLEAARAAGGDVSILQSHVPSLIRAFEAALGEGAAARAFTEVAEQALDALPTFFDVSRKGRKALDEQVERLRASLPAGGSVLGFSPAAAPLLHARAVRQVVEPRRQDLIADLRTLASRVREILRFDASPSGDGGAAVAALGGGPRELFDADAIARTLPARGRSQSLEPERREIFERTLATLEQGTRHLEEQPTLFVVTAEPMPAALRGDDVRELRHPDAGAAAVGVFDGIVASIEELLRARRRARLLLEGRHDASIHEPMLSRFGWEGFEQDELLACPRVVVLERAERLRGASLSSFSELLRSARPIHLLVSEDVSGLLAGETWEALAGYHRGLGHLAVAHREAFVAQCSLTKPSHLVDSFQRMARALRPAVAVVALPARSAPVPPWTQAVAALAGRAMPCFRHDPDAGAAWADRFDLAENPDAEKPWPGVTVAIRDRDGEDAVLESVFDFACAAALAPSHREWFRVIPPEAWSDNQLELASWLAGGHDSLSKLPFTWIVDEGGTLQRAVMTRELAFACRDRVEAWHVLQELGGTDNEHARRAAAAARERALADAAEREAEREREHLREVEEARAGAARAAMSRLAQALLDLDLDAISVAGPAPPPRTTATPEPAPVEGAVEAPERAEERAPAPPDDEDDELDDEPWVDSPLCTSCNDCLQINAQLFVYDENKQARIGDLQAGTFLQLVTAAEKCPAKCIHPGKPRDGDETATEELLERAARFR